MEASALPSLPATWTDDAPSCTLPTAERPLRQTEFDDLFADALVDARRPAADHATLVLAGPVGTERRARDLTERESSCCSFFNFTISADPTPGAAETLALDIRVPPTRAGVLDALVLRARAAATGRSGA